MAVELLGGMDGLRDPQQGLLHGVILLFLVEYKETAAADPGETAALRQIGVQDGQDALQQVMAEAGTVLQADGIVFRHVEEQCGIILAVQPVFVRVLQGIHEYATVAEEFRLGVDETDAFFLLLLLCRQRLWAGEEDEDADDLIVFPDGVLRYLDFLDPMIDVHLLYEMQQWLSRCHDLFLSS